jgi:protein SCO1/2
MMLRTLLLTTTALLALSVSAPAKDRTDPLPKDLKQVDIVEHPDAQVPADLAFVNELGNPVTLGDYMNQGKPVILTLNYYGCPMLCTLLLNGMVDTLRELPLRAGTDYEIVTVSFNPQETAMLAKQKQQNYLDYWGAGGSSSAWHFLTGKKEQIDELCRVTGFDYTYVESTGEYAHPAALMVLTPAGRLSRYIYGVKFDAQTLKLSLVEAGQGKIGTPLDHILLYCYHYDAVTGGYAPVAMNIMRLAGTVTVILLALVLGAFWANEKRRSGGNTPPARPATPGVSNI